MYSLPMEGWWMMSKIQAVFYDLPNGTYPAQEFIDSLDVKMQAKMLRTIMLLQENGTDLRMPYSEHLEEGIFELRAKVGSNISRVMYFFFDGSKAILTHGFIKKTQKTPKSEIEKAKRYRADYLSRKGHTND